MVSDQSRSQQALVTDRVQAFHTTLLLHLFESKPQRKVMFYISAAGLAVGAARLSLELTTICYLP